MPNSPSRTLEQQALLYYARRHAPDWLRHDAHMHLFRSHMSPQQLQFVGDTSKDVLACTGRQAGKTTADAWRLIIAALAYPGQLIGYVALTRKNAKLLMWMELQQLNSRHNLGLHFHTTDLIVTTPANARIWLTGADNESQVEKFRGFRFKLIILDEAQSYGPFFEYLLVDVIDAALIANQGGRIMTGTPNPTCSGFFYEACTDIRLGWSQHHWTVLENPYIPHAAAWLEERRRSTNMPKETYEREWLGLWVPDLHSLVYHYSAELNSWDGVLPGSPQPWEYGLGIDIGFDPDPMAFTVVGWNRHIAEVYVLETQRFVGMIPSRAAEHIRELDNKYHFNTMVGDNAGLGKAIIAEWRQRFSLPIKHARDKHLKKEHIQLQNNDFRMGLIKIKAGLPIEHELKQVLWNDDRKEISDRYPNDLTDSLEYIYLEAKHYCARPIQPAPSLGSEEWARREAARYEQRAIEKAQARERDYARYGRTW